MFWFVIIGLAVALMLTRRRPPMEFRVLIEPVEPTGLGGGPWVIAGLAILVLWALLTT